MTAHDDRIRAQALQEAADAIQAIHPGETKNSVTFLRARADEIAPRQGVTRQTLPPLTLGQAIDAVAHNIGETFSSAMLVDLESWTDRRTLAGKLLINFQGSGIGLPERGVYFRGGGVNGEITTVRELDSLPPGSVVIDRDGIVFQAEDEPPVGGHTAWVGTGAVGFTTSAVGIALPVTLLHRSA